MLIELTPIMTTSELADMCNSLKLGEEGLFHCPLNVFFCPFGENISCGYITTEDWERLFGNKQPEQEEL